MCSKNSRESSILQLQFPEKYLTCSRQPHLPILITRQILSGDISYEVGGSGQSTRRLMAISRRAMRKPQCWHLWNRNISPEKGGILRAEIRECQVIVLVAL